MPGQTVTVEEADTMLRIYDGQQLLTEVLRITNRQVARFKARKPEAPRQTSRGDANRLPEPASGTAVRHTLPTHTAGGGSDR